MEIVIDFKSEEMKLNKQTVQQGYEPFAVNGVFYLPLRFISESLGAKVEWSQQNENIAITMK
ncbi:stalk domain-containing protein [Paenibacillus sp. GCM10027626]|uniref:stalk domain-containing protein n=1 Tax=Paenibacillus sp. GCM10027626 TaxID=3273411 RepID=UPI0036420089